MQPMKLETVKAELIRPYWRNPRKNEAAVAAVAKSIKEFGYNSPIIVDAENVIIAGHTRYRALMLLGYDEIQVNRVNLPLDVAKRYRIADNSTGEFADWDMDALMSELREIGAADDMQDYFSDLDITKIVEQSFGKAVEPASDEDVAEQTQKNEAAFEDRAKEQASEMITVTCPECGSDFSVRRNDILTRPDEA